MIVVDRLIVNRPIRAFDAPDDEADADPRIVVP